MAWTTPRTWVAGETVTDAQLNTHLRDNLIELRGSRTCRVKQTASQTMLSGPDPWGDAVAFNAEDEDPHGWHSIMTNNSRITPNVAGLYQVTAGVEFEANGTGSRAARIGVNGIGVGQAKGQVTIPAASGIPTIVTLSAQVRVNGTTDYVVVGAWQNSGSSIDTGLSIGAWCAVTWIGA